MDDSVARTLACLRPRGGALSGPAALCLLIREGATVYRPHHPEQTDFYRTVDTHFED